jgi:hypothetical protein
MIDRTWIDSLDDEDLAFLKRFLLTSGTLKELARQYGISYPTVRLRLDRLIEKVKLLDQAVGTGPFERSLRLAYADGRLDTTTFRALIDAYRQEKEESGEKLSG